MAKIRLKQNKILLQEPPIIPTPSLAKDMAPIQQHNRPSVEPKDHQIPQDSPAFDDEFCDAAVLSQSYPYYCGGRAYDLNVHIMLRELGYNSILYTDFKPTYNHSDYMSYQQPKVKIVNVRHVSLPCSSSFWGSPLLGAIRSIELAAYYKKPLRLIVYDCPQWLVSNTYIGEYHARFEVLAYTEIKHHLQTAVDDIPDLKIYTLTENSIDDWAKWLELDVSHFRALQPCINSRVADSLKNDLQKEKWIVSISRNDYRKGWEETIQIFNQYADDYDLHIVTNYLDGFEGYLQKHKVPNYKVHFHQGISDMHKFELIKRSKVLFSASHFEGFGMWAAEGLKCGTDVVCYNLRSLADISHPRLHKAILHDKDSLAKTLGDVLDSDCEMFDPVDDFDYDVGLNTMSNIVSLDDKTIDEFDVVAKPEFNDIQTKWKTTPIVFHFNSIYKQNIAKQQTGSHICWRNILSHILHNKPDCHFEDVKDQLTIFTFSTYPRKTLLESVCDHLGVDLVVFRPSVKVGQWQHNDRIQFSMDALKTINTPYVLHIDAEDAVVCGDLRKLLDIDTVLYAAETMCHPVSSTIEEQQEALVPNNAHFKYLNAGVMFGKRDNVLDVFTIAAKLSKYDTPNAGDSNSDQGKHNQVYIEHHPAVQIDYDCRFFYCNDHKTNASDHLVFINE